MNLWQILFAVAVLCTCAAILISVHFLARIRNRNDPLAAVRMIPEFTERPISPFARVSFEQALNSSSLENELGSYGRSYIGYAFGLDTANVAIQGLALSSERLQIVYEFSQQGTHLVKTGNAVIPLEKGSGGMLPMLSDAKTHEFLEQAKGHVVHIDRARLAEISSIVVSIAHIVSNADLVKRLERTERKLDRLLIGRSIDQTAELGSIYSMVRERSSRDMIGESNLSTEWRRKLQVLRRTWSGEIESQTKIAPDPSKAKWYALGTWTAEWRDNTVAKHLAGIAEKVRLCRVALLVDLYLAFETGATEGFVKTTVKDEFEAWTAVTQNLKLLANAATTDRGEYTRILSQVCQAYEEVLRGMSLLPAAKDR